MVAGSTVGADVIGLNVLKIMLGETPNREHVSRVLNTVIYPLVTQSKR